MAFTGSYQEAQLVCSFLSELGLHPIKLPDLSTAYFGPVGTARVTVPEEELDKALEYLKEITSTNENEYNNSHGDEYNNSHGERPVDDQNEKG